MSDYERSEAKKMLQDGISPNKVARVLGVDVKAVHRLQESLSNGQ